MRLNHKRKAWMIDVAVTTFTILVGWFVQFPPEGDEADLLLSGLDRTGFSLLMAIVLLGILSRMQVRTLSGIEKVNLKFNLVPWQFVMFFLVVICAGQKVVHFSITELLDKEGFAGAQRLFSGMAQPKLELFPQAIVNMVQTLFMAFMSTLVAIPIAFVLGFFAARNLMNKSWARVLRQGLRLMLNLVSSIEALIWAIIFSVWVGIGPFAGVLALTVQSIVSLARGFSELIEVSSPGPIEGIRATGANSIQVVWFGILPQVFLPFLSTAIYRWDMNIRMATVVGLVGGGGIGTLMIQNLGQGLWHELGSIIIVIAFSIWILDIISSYAREHLK